MSERPILFSGEMVRAILDGRKTQTRRVVKPDWWRCLDPEDPDDRAQALTMCPYGQPGDRLWVRETFAPPLCIPCEAGVIAPCVCQDASKVDYRADGGDRAGYWKPSIHMPRWASRIDLEVTDVRVERLQEIRVADVMAEGLPEMTACRASFFALWDEINAKRGYAWADNPWVWVVTFKRTEPAARAE